VPESYLQEQKAREAEHRRTLDLHDAANEKRRQKEAAVLPSVPKPR
jgi:hypothetical protein